MTNPTFQSLKLTTSLHTDISEPKNKKTALSKPHWLAAMNEELGALKSNITGTLVPGKPHMNVVGSRSVFKTKLLHDGSVKRFKARLVAKGYNQLERVYFDNTFGPVVKATTIQLVLSIAVTLNWHIKQLDVKNAFFHGELNEIVFMKKPPDFLDPIFPNHVCLLKKALYGLKQAPKAWFHKFSSYLLHLGYSCSKADPSLFVFHSSKGSMFLLLYVDDIVLTGSNSFLLNGLVDKLRSRFAMKDMGDLQYFLGIEVHRTSAGIFFNQAKYMADILRRSNMLGARAIKILHSI